MASECLAAAKQTTDPRERTSLVDIAQKSLDLAELCEHDGYTEALRLRALEAAIGEELRALFEPPHRLPHRLLTLLMQLNTPSEPD
jgi:hypothetical protein